MRITKRENNLLALHVGLVTNADHVHLLAEAFGDADDGVVGQRARQTMQRRLIVRSALGAQLFAFELETDARSGIGVFRLPFGPFTSSSLLVNGDGTPFGNVIAFLPMRDIINFRFDCQLRFEH